MASRMGNEAAGAEQMIGTAGDQLQRIATLVRRSLSHFWKAAAVGAVIVAIALGIALLKRRVYLSEAVVLYRPGIDPSALGNVAAGPREDTKEIGARLEELLKARPRLSKIIDKFKLYPQVLSTRGYVEAVDRMRRDILFTVGQGDTFHISFRAGTPRLARDVTAELASSLIEQETSLRQEQAEATLAFLTSETMRLQQELNRRQAGVAKFLSANPEFALEEQRDTPGASIRAMRQRMRQGARSGDVLGVLQRQASRLRAQLANPDAAVPTAPADPQLVAAKERAEEDLREATSTLSRNKSNYTARHPDVISAEKRVAEAKAALARVKQAVRTSQRLRAPKKTDAAAKEAMRERLANLERQISSTRRAPKSVTVTTKASDRIVALETEWQKVNRDARQARDAYVKLEERLFKARLSASSESAKKSAQLRIVDPAYEPTKPAGIGRTMIVAGGMVVAVFLGGLLMLGLAFVDHRIYDRLDIERVGIASVLVEVPRAGAKDVNVRRLLRPGSKNA